MKPFGTEESGGWCENIDGVAIESHERAIAGWAVYSGCEGDDPSLVAFVTRRELADAMLPLKDADGEVRIFDGCVVPAVLLADNTACAGLFSSNHFDDERSVVALAKRFGLDPGAWR
jgi:hypothetical protein